MSSSEIEQVNLDLLERVLQKYGDQIPSGCLLLAIDGQDFYKNYAHGGIRELNRWLVYSLTQAQADGLDTTSENIVVATVA